MTVMAEIENSQLSELIKKVQAGDEILLTRGNKPVARIGSASDDVISSGKALNIRSLKGHRILSSNITQEDLADEMFGQR